MNNPLTLSASQIARVMLCPPSARRPLVPIGSSSQEATLGSAVHYILNQTARGQTVSW